MSSTLSVPDGLLFAACVAFVIGLKQMGHKESAKRGNLVSSFGMAAAVIGALWQTEAALLFIILTIAVGGVVGFILAIRVKMTSMPELIAIFNGLGGLASLCVGVVGLLPESGSSTLTQALSAASVVIGGIAFTGSFVAYAKLAGHIEVAAVTFPLQLTLSFTAILIAVAAGVWVAYGDVVTVNVIVLVCVSLVLGVLGVVRIGGGDMPVVVALLNSYSGIAAALAGTAIANPTLMVAGTLVGASGFMLTRVMCKSMNRSLASVLFGGFGTKSFSTHSSVSMGGVKSLSVEDAFLLIESARSVMIVPGYGMAVAKAQHAVHELSELLIANGTEVRFIIHPVAGRMPGHMNVLLAEAGVEYDQLVTPEDASKFMQGVDVALVIGANDVVNTDARDNPESPLYGMPIVDVDRARTVIVLKRGVSKGFAGVENSLFCKANTHMLFGDAKGSISGIIERFSQLEVSTS